MPVDIFVNDMAIHIADFLVVVCPLSGILFLCSKVMSLIHEISSTQGKYKVFSTHLSQLSLSHYITLD
jgi:hypothetical protein